MAVAQRLRVLSEEQVDYFWTNGFVVVDDVLGEAQIQHLTATLQDLVDRPADKRAVDFQVDFNSDSALRNINHFTRYWIAGMELIRNPRVLGAVRDLIGDDVRFHHTKVMLKRAHEGTIISWHQDLASYVRGEEKERLIAMGADLTARDTPFVAAQHYLDGSTLENGCLCFVRGSNHWGLRPTLRTPEARAAKSREDYFPPSIVEKVPVKAGSVALFHSLTFHYSGPNNSPVHRRAPIVQYFSPPTFALESGDDQVTLPFGERLTTA